MNDYNAGQITRLCAGGQFVAATGITGAVDTHTQGDHTAEGLSQNGAAHKTKATPKDRQWLHTKQGQDNRNSATTPAPNACLVAGGGAYSCSLGSGDSSGLGLLLPILPRLTLRLLRRDFKYPSIANAIGLKSGLSGASLSGGFLVMAHALGSMPRCCNSLRMIRFIQAAKDSSPSSCCAVSIISRKSGSKRNWKGGFPRLSFLCVDTSITPCVEYMCDDTLHT